MANLPFDLIMPKRFANKILWLHCTLPPGEYPREIYVFSIRRGNIAFCQHLMTFCWAKFVCDEIEKCCCLLFRANMTRSKDSELACSCSIGLKGRLNPASQAR